MNRTHFRLACVLVLMTILALNSCLSDKRDYPDVNSQGHRYTYHYHSNGRQARAGEHILYHVYQRADDSLVNNSRARPIQPRLVVPDSSQAKKLRNPINEALLRMAVGDSLTISIPMNEIAQRPAGFSDYQYLHFDLVVTDIQSAEKFRQEIEDERQRSTNRRDISQSRKKEIKTQLLRTLTAYMKGALDDSLKEKPSGLKYYVHELGNGALPKAGELIRVYFYCMFPSGETLTHTFDHGEPYQFLLNEGTVIPAWEEAMADLPPGSRATLFVPPHLAYGEDGKPPSIPPKTELIYYIEVLE